ncbi:MAG: HD domain-containing phosphohydrolase [Chloroflexota bacterium]
MYQNVSINLMNLLLSVSDALDLASPELSQHQLRTAFVAWEMGRAANLSDELMEQLFVAALLHDVGALSVEEKTDLHRAEVSNPEHHCILGERFLRRLPMFEPSAKIVRFHHTTWQEWEKSIDQPLVFQAQILSLADTVERALDRKLFILYQREDLISRIAALTGVSFHANVVELFKSVAVREDFWFDLVSPRLYSLLLHDGPGRGKEISLSHLKGISELIRNMIDFRSRFTATHSAGVAAAASTIARLLGLTESEVEMMEVAGNLHDLGKMAVPNRILDKPDKLTKNEIDIVRQHTYFTYSVLMTIGGIQNIAEWAAFHHERLDGSGYPFHIGATKLGIGARIMAVADVFTALAEDRSYRAGMKKDRVLSVLNTLCEKNHIDKIVAQILENNYEEVAVVTSKRQTEARECYEHEFTHG